MHANTSVFRSADADAEARTRISYLDEIISYLDEIISYLDEMLINIFGINYYN